VSEQGWSVARLDEIERIGGWAPVRAHFGIEAFGVNAWFGDEGAAVIPDHEETPSGHEELYLVIAGHATFTVNGEEVDAPMGTIVFVRDPAAQRGAKALEAGTTVLTVGGEPGKAYAVRGWEANAKIIPYFESGEFAEAKRLIEEALEENPDAAGLIYNLACAEARLGNTGAAVGALKRAIELHDGFRQYVATDDDLESIRDHPDVQRLVAETEPAT
jgi:tetratricopeptide (TPR) repeat protein